MPQRGRRAATALAVVAGAIGQLACQPTTGPAGTVGPAVAAPASPTRTPEVAMASIRPATSPGSPASPVGTSSLPSSPASPTATSVASGGGGSASGGSRDQAFVPASASGSASLQGQALVGATVQVFRAGGSELLATGTTDAAGRFQLGLGPAAIPGTPLRIQVTAGATTLAGLDLAAQQPGQFQLLAAKDKGVTEGTTLALKLAPTIEAVFAATGPGAAGEVGSQLLGTLDDLAVVAQQAMERLEGENTGLDADQARAAVNYILQGFTGATGGSLPPAIASMLIAASQQGQGGSRSPLENAFAKATQELDKQLVRVAQVAATEGLTLEALTFGQISVPAKKLATTPLGDGEIAIKAVDGQFLKDPAGPAVVLPGPGAAR